MKKQTNVGLIVGLAAGAAAVIAGTLATIKTAIEIKRDLQQIEFISADQKNSVIVEFGTSNFARGLTLIKIKADMEDGKDTCKFSFLSRRSDFLGEWTDENHFELSAGKGKSKQFCDVNFEGEEIVITYSFKKLEISVSDTEEPEELEEAEEIL